MERIGHYYQSLYGVATAINSVRTSDDVINSIVRNVTRTIGAEDCSLMLLSSDKKLLLHTVTYGLNENLLLI